MVQVQLYAALQEQLKTAIAPVQTYMGLLSLPSMLTACLPACLTDGLTD